ncbi:MAG: PaaI family thioesterase [Roseburia hominis]
MDNYKSKESLSRVVMNQTFEDMKEIVRKNPFAQHIGMELLEVTEGYALGRIRLAKQYENIYGECTEAVHIPSRTRYPA